METFDFLTFTLFLFHIINKVAEDYIIGLTLTFRQLYGQ